MRSICSVLMPRTRALPYFLVCLLLFVVARPAGAEDLNKKRDAMRNKRSEVGRQLDLARASDDRVEAEVARLGRAVAAQQGNVDGARQAQWAAEQAVGKAAKDISDVTARSQAVRKQIVDRAVTSYVHPSGSVIEEVLRSGSLSEASRRMGLLAQVQGSETQLLDQYRGVRSDLADAKQRFELARAETEKRAKREADAQQRLVAAQRQQEAAHKELTGRIADLQRESAELAGQDRQIQALLQKEAAASAAALARVPAGQILKGLKPSGSGFIWPIHGPVTSEFGPRWGGFHPGIDIGMDTGTPVAAAKRGAVSFAGWNDGGYGNFVVIDHGDGTATAYAHLSQIGTSTGQVVSQGQIIGAVGSTGHSTGPHLHFEIRSGGVAQNPRAYEGAGP